MALKNLYSDLSNTSSYPNHTNPLFNYGTGSPIFSGIFEQIGLSFNNGTAYDQPGQNYSSEPFIKSPIQGGFADVGITINSLTEGFIRGGAITHAERLTTDTERITKFYLSPRGVSFLAKQVGLQLSNPQIRIGNLFTSPGSNQRTYNFGVNTLAQVAASGTGLHIKREGILPTSFNGYKDDLNLTKKDTQSNDYDDIDTGNRLLSLFETHIGPQTTEFSTNENTGNGGLFAGTALGNFIEGVGDVFDDINEFFGGNPNPELYSFNGGAGSTYGIGKTTLYRYDNTNLDLLKRNVGGKGGQGIDIEKSKDEDNQSVTDNSLKNEPRLKGKGRFIFLQSDPIFRNSNVGGKGGQGVDITNRRGTDQTIVDLTDVESEYSDYARGGSGISLQTDFDPENVLPDDLTIKDRKGFAIRNSDVGGESGQGVDITDRISTDQSIVDLTNVEGEYSNYTRGGSGISLQTDFDPENVLPRDLVIKEELDSSEDSGTAETDRKKLAIRNSDVGGESGQGVDTTDRKNTDQKIANTKNVKGEYSNYSRRGSGISLQTDFDPENVLPDDLVFGQTDQKTREDFAIRNSDIGGKYGKGISDAQVEIIKEKDQQEIFNFTNSEEPASAKTGSKIFFQSDPNNRNRESFSPTHDEEKTGKQESKYNTLNTEFNSEIISNYHVSYDGDPDAINLQSFLPSTEQGSYPESGAEDFIPFRFEVVNTQNPLLSDFIVFRAFLDSFDDKFNASHNEFSYNGRGESFYTYSGFTRNISFQFKIAAQSQEEMRPLYRKLNYLLSNTAPEYSNIGRMRTPFIKLTVGDWCNKLPGILNGIQLSWEKDYPWDLGGNPDTDSKTSGLILPHVLNVSVEFTPVHQFMPEKSHQSSFDSNVFINTPFLNAE